MKYDGTEEKIEIRQVKGDNVQRKISMGSKYSAPTATFN
jgi:hypothetical protein